MNYLNDLLESYNRLKKRTFRIEFINEDEGNPVDTKAEGELRGILMGAPPAGGNIAASFAPIAAPRYPGLGKFQYVKTRDNTGVNVKGFVGKGPMTAKVLDNGVFSTKPGAQKMLEALYAAMRGEGDSSPEEKTSQTIQQSLEELENRIGGTFEQQQLEVTPNTIANIQESYKHLKAFEKTLGDDKGDLENLFKMPMAYLAGASRFGLEYKLAHGNAYLVDADGKATPGSKLGPDMIEMATESHAVLTAFLAGEGDCDELVKRVGTMGKDLALFSSEPNEAVVIPPNALQNAALSKAKDKCGPGKLRDIQGALATNTKNSIKGTFYEVVTRMAVALVKAKSLPPEQQAAAIQKIGEDFSPIIDQKRNELRQSATTRDFEAATDIDSYFESQILQEQLGISDSEETIRAFLLSEIKPLVDLITTIGADTAIDNSKAANTGGREDTFMGFESEEAAKSAAEKFGVEAYWNSDNNMWTIGTGQKRSEKGEKVKMGEFNSEDRRNAVMNEFAQPGKRLEAGFYKKVDDIHGISESRKESAIAYGKRLDAKIKKLRDLLTTDTTYTTAEGGIKVQSAEENFKLLTDKLSEYYTPEELKETGIGQAILKGDSKYADFSDPAVRARVVEHLTREYRWQQLKKDQGKQNCKDYLVRQTLLTSANAREMLQVIQSDDGRVRVLNHNDILRRLVKEGVPKVSGYGVSFDFGGGTVRMSQEGTTNTPKPSANNPNPTPKRDTRTTVNVNKGILESMDLYSDKVKSGRKDEMFIQFLKGQQQLIETIIQTRTSFPL